MRKVFIFEHLWAPNSGLGALNIIGILEKRKTFISNFLLEYNNIVGILVSTYIVFVDISSSSDYTLHQTRNNGIPSPTGWLSAQNFIAGLGF